jgi:hypothetical protein
MPSNTYYLDEDNTIPAPQKGSRRFNPRTPSVFCNQRPMYCSCGSLYCSEASQIVPNVRAWKKTKGFREKFVKKTKHYVKSDD